MASPIRILVLSSTRKERDGIAEYTRQVFRPEFQKPGEVEFNIRDISFRNIMAAPFSKHNVIHIQHEFFMFDRFVGITALFYYMYLWFWSRVLGFKLVTTIHSTYNVQNLEAALPHFRKFNILFPLGSLYLRWHLRWVTKLSDRVIILSKIGLENMRRILTEREMTQKIRYTHLGNYSSNIRMQSHGILGQRFGMDQRQSIFTLFGFAFPNKGYEYAIFAMDTLIHQRGRKTARLMIVSGETGKGSFPGGGQGGTYVGWLRQLVVERKLEDYVLFTGYLANEDPLLEEIFANTLCFIFPYLDRNFPSGAISTALATGKPMLVSDIRCFQEYERLPKFPEKNAAALAERMEVLMDSSDAVSAAAAITHRNATLFSMSHIFQTHCDVYAQAVSNGR